MEGFVDFLISYGNPGMFIAALLSGSICPFISSEAVMIALLAFGAEPWGLLVWASIGNIIGGIICYYLGCIGSPEWIQKALRVNQEKMERAALVADKHGALAAFFGFVPLLGSAIIIVLGLMHADAPKTLISMSAGKVLRYLIIVLPAIGITWLIAH